MIGAARSGASPVVGQAQDVHAPTELARELNSLHFALGNLESVISALAARLGPALAPPADASAGNCSADPVRSFSALGQQIENATAQIDLQVVGIRSLLERLAI